MECFDTHTHSEGKGITELKAMSDAGIKKIVSCAYYPVTPSAPSTLIDMFRKLTSFEVKRGKKVGMELIPAIGVHPRCICNGWEKALSYIEENPPVVIGEIGLENASDLEVEVLKAQLKLAEKLDVPCIVHTPRKNKAEVTEKILNVLSNSGISPELVVVDHLNSDIIENVFKIDYWCGLTVQPGKISVEEAVSIIENYGFDRFVLNSDTGFNDEEMLTVAETVKALESKFDKEDVEKVAFKNAEKFLKLKR